MKVEWQDYLSIGILEIDIQHKLLFDKFNAFLEACEQNRGDEEISRLFWFLEAYTLTHFKEEEGLMQRLSHPGLAMHREQHQAFIQKVAEFKESLRQSGPTPSLVLTVTRFVSTWLFEHISRLDRAIGNPGAGSPS